MKNTFKYFFVGALFFSIAFLTGCEDFLKPYGETGKYDGQILWGNPSLAEGVLLRAYGQLQTDYVRIDEYGNDDAVTNKLDHNMIVAATGGWTARSNPLDAYASIYSSMLQLNLFIENVDKVKWSSTSSIKDSLFKERLKGEAYGLRAFYGYLLLRNVGGKNASGKLLGYPIVTTSNLSFEEAKLPRNSYSDCVKQIFEDCDNAFKLLPLRWTDTGLNTEEREVKGARYQNRINGISSKLIKARVALMAASEAFKESGVTMLQAAEYAAEIITINGFDKMSSQDSQFYLQARNASDLSYFAGNSEIFWYSFIQAKSSNREVNFFPPSLYGLGLINPSQNLVNAFGDSYGYPIETSSVYNNTKPYLYRDPRFYMYILSDGTYTEKGALIDIKNGEKDGIGKTVNSTRTGYYMRKLLDENVILTPGLITSTPHYFVFARYTEALLIFAEAANQAVGPNISVGGFTARDIILKIRARSGIFSTAYVDGLDKDGLTILIRNERRIELCFEGFRFWDLRRWNDLTTMNKAVNGINLQTMTPIEVEQRIYQQYMIYAPIPYSETLKYNIEQNAGWN